MTRMQRQVGNSDLKRRPLFLASPPLDKNGVPVIRKVLIANRGEIACRVISQYLCYSLNNKNAVG